VSKEQLATVVIGTDADAVGRAVVELAARGWRTAGFVGDPAGQCDALVEMIAELFPSESSG
jgi:hypothetical protein